MESVHTAICICFRPVSVLESVGPGAFVLGAGRLTLPDAVSPLESLSPLAAVDPPSAGLDAQAVPLAVLPLAPEGTARRPRVDSADLEPEVPRPAVLSLTLGSGTHTVPVRLAVLPAAAVSAAVIEVEPSARDHARRDPSVSFRHRRYLHHPNSTTSVAQDASSSAVTAIVCILRGTTTTTAVLVPQVILGDDWDALYIKVTFAAAQLHCQPVAQAVCIGNMAGRPWQDVEVVPDLALTHARCLRSVYLSRQGIWRSIDPRYDVYIVKDFLSASRMAKQTPSHVLVWR